MFEEMRIKRLLKKTITKEMYEKLPHAIKRDARIVEKFLSGAPNNVNYLYSDIMAEQIKKDYSLCRLLSEENLNSVFRHLDISKMDIDAELFSKLNGRNSQIVLEQDPKTYFQLVDEERLSEDLSEVISHTLRKERGVEVYTGKAIEPKLLREIVLSLGPDKIGIIANKGNFDSKSYVIELIRSLPIEEQLGLYEQNNELFDCLNVELQEDIQITACNDEIDKILELPEALQIKYFTSNLEQLKYAPYKITEQILSTGKVRLTAEELIDISYTQGYYVWAYSVDKTLDSEEMLRLFNGGGNNVKRLLNMYYDSRDERVLQTRKLVDLQLSSVEDTEKRQAFLDIFNSCMKEHSSVSYYTEETCRCCSLLFDERVIKTVEPELLLKYVKTGEQSVLIEILSNAYGEHVRDIFNERPMLTLNEIPTFRVFDKNIIDRLGVEFVHYAVSYNYEYFGYQINDITENIDEMDNFKNFWEYSMSRNAKFDSSTLYSIFKNFSAHKELLSQLDLSNMSEHQMKMLDLYLKECETVGPVVHSIDDLDNYLTIRTERFTAVMEAAEYTSDKQNVVFSYLTGRIVNPGIETIDSMGLQNVINVFNVRNIIKNPDLIEEMGLNSDEVALLLLLNQVNDIRDPQVLNDVFLAVSNSKELDPTKFNSTFDKIQDYYVERFREGLTNSEQLDQMPRAMVDGIPVISFEGEQFDLLCSVTGIGMSVGTCRWSGETLLNNWLNLEDGVSSISCTLCSSDICPNPTGLGEINHNITFVFDDDIDIIGMGGTDISSGHSSRDPHHRFECIGYNGMKFAAIDEIKQDTVDNIREMSRNGMHKFPNEVSVRRKEEDIRTIEGTQKRKMPIGLYVVGEITEEVLETARVFSDYYRENNLGEFRIIRVNPEKYRVMTTNHYQRPQQEMVDSNVSWYQEAQEPINKGSK